MHVVRIVQCTVSQLHYLEIAVFYKDSKYALCSSRIAKCSALCETTHLLGRRVFIITVRICDLCRIELLVLLKFVLSAVTNITV